MKDEMEISHTKSLCEFSTLYFRLVCPSNVKERSSLKYEHLMSKFSYIKQQDEVNNL